MDPLINLEKLHVKASSELSTWLAGITSAKSSTQSSVDSFTAQKNPQPLSIETLTLPEIQLKSDPSLPQAGSSSASEGGDEDGKKYATEEWVEDQGYATEEWVEDQGYATEEWVEDQGYATKEWVEDQGYATKEWVEDNLRAYPTWSETNETYVDWGTFNDFTGSQAFSDAVARVVQNSLGFTIQCNGDGTVTGYLTWGGLQQ